MTPKSFSSIQCLRAIAALLVLSCHIGAMEQKYTFHPILPEWGKYGVDLFFVISGFIMVYISRPHWGEPSRAAPFLLKRIFRIYPVYWQFTSVILIFMLVYPDLLATQNATGSSVWKSLLLWPQKVDPVLGVGWSLVHEMYFYLLFCFAFLLPRRVLPFALAAWFLALLTVRTIGLNIGIDSGEIWLITSPLGFEFMMGCLVAWLLEKHVRLSPLLPLILAVAWCLLANSLWDAEASLSWRVIIWGIPAALLLYAAVIWETSGERCFPLWLRHIGDASYSLYLCHALVVSALGKLWHKLAFDGVAMQLLFILFAVALPIGIALLNYRYFELPILRWYHHRAKALSRR